jgi:hypothetical protein
MMAAMLATMVAPSAANATRGDEWRSWTNVKLSDTPPLVLDIAGNPPAPAGAAAVVSRMWIGSNGQQVGDQQWRQVFIDHDTFIFRGAGTSNQYALSISNNSATNGTQVVQWWYQANNAYQQWTYTEKTQSDGEVFTQFKNVGTGKCLAVAGAGDGRISPGDKVIIWGCGSGQDQWWSEYDT